MGKELSKFDSYCKEIEKTLLFEYRDHLIGKIASIIAMPEELGDDLNFLKIGYQVTIIDFIGDKDGDMYYKVKTHDGREIELPTDSFEVYGVGSPATSYYNSRTKTV